MVIKKGCQSQLPSFTTSFEPNLYFFGSSSIEEGCIGTYVYRKHSASLHAVFVGVEVEATKVFHHLYNYRSIN